MLAGYATVCVDGLLLSRRERGMRIRYESVGVLKLAQLGVDRSFQGRGLGGLIVADIVRLAREISRRAGCRYLTVDAVEEVVAWYEGGLGFKRNRLMQEHRIRLALERQRDPERLAISMRFDIRDG